MHPVAAGAPAAPPAPTVVRTSCPISIMPPRRADCRIGQGSAGKHSGNHQSRDFIHDILPSRNGRRDGGRLEQNSRAYRRLAPAVNPTRADAHPVAAGVPGAIPAPMAMRASDPPSAMVWRPANHHRRIGRGGAAKHSGDHPGNYQSIDLAHGILPLASPPSQPATPRARRRGNARRRCRNGRDKKRAASRFSIP
jgi:hypothetical protein